MASSRGLRRTYPDYLEPRTRPSTHSERGGQKARGDACIFSCCTATDTSSLYPLRYSVQEKDVIDLEVQHLVEPGRLRDALETRRGEQTLQQAVETEAAELEVSVSILETRGSLNNWGLTSFPTRFRTPVRRSPTPPTICVSGSSQAQG